MEGRCRYWSDVFDNTWSELLSINWMAQVLTHIKKTMKMYVIDSNNLINIRVSHSGLDYLVTDFVTFLW